MHSSRQLDKKNLLTQHPFITHTAEEAYLRVLDSAGAILPRRDAIDLRITRETRTGTATYEGATYALVTSAGITHPSGIIDSPTNVGGILNMATIPLIRMRIKMGWMIFGSWLMV
jgi:hypothetical protein